MKNLNSEIARWAKSPRFFIVLILPVLATAFWWWLAAPDTSALASSHLTTGTSYAVTQPLPQSVTLDADKVALGRRLFHDARLSVDDSISCASCHNLTTGGVDNRSRSIGVRGGIGSVNAPTVFNSGFNFVQFWDGRAETLESQIDGPVQHPKEMASTWAQVSAKLANDANYASDFARLYGTPPSPDAVKDAIATFERSLVTPNARFDRYLRGDQAALSSQELHGYALFQSYGCASCHQGINLGGNMYEKMGLMGDYFKDRGHVTEADNGRFNVNHDPDSRHEFRVPSLRNVALTAPYFHDGNAQTLEEAVTIMSKYQLGRVMPSDHLQAVVAFLRTLNGEFEGRVP